MTDWRDIVSMIENFGAKFIRDHPADSLSAWNRAQPTQPEEFTAPQPDPNNSTVSG
jgi:hypothetical protein